VSAVVKQSDPRRRELAAIHCRKKELGLDEETYRAMLWTVARVHSSRDLDAAGRRAVLDHMRSRSGDRRLQNSDSRDRGPLLRKIKAMLDARDRKIAYADGMARKMFHTARVEWCTPEQLKRIVAALVYDQRRYDAAGQS
jgi:phage gp16-like protein